MRQRGHNPLRELDGSAPPHCGQTGVDGVLISNTYRLERDCYKLSAFRENAREIAQFRVEFRAIRQRVGNLFAIQLAKPFAEPMRGYTSGAFTDSESGRYRAVINR